MQFDYESFKIEVMSFFYKRKKFLVFTFFIIIAGVLFISNNINEEYNRKIKSSNQLLDYIQNKNKVFLVDEQKNGYQLVKKIIQNKNNPKKENYDELIKIDDFLFKDLFFFARKLFFGFKSENDPLFESDKHPWNKLFSGANVFHGQYKDFKDVKNKEHYVVYYLIGKGYKCL